MKKLFTPLLFLFALGANAQNLSEIQDRLALKELVDTFSNLADTKDIPSQIQLFTKDAVVESFRNGVSVSKLTGHDEIGGAFEAFLSNFEVVYHQNGQQTVSIDGDHASGISYCTVTLISNSDGVNVMTKFGVRYSDEYSKKGGKWLIKNRKSYFMWENTTNLGF